MSAVVIIERAICPSDAEVTDFFQAFNVRLGELPARARHFAVELVAREAVQNAIDYGCGRDPKHRAHVELGLDGEILILKVDDNGPGFDPETVLALERSRESGISGNGLSLIAAYSDRYHYENGGRTLVAEFILREATSMQETKEQGRWAPSGDIVAANAQSAKDELRGLVGSSSGELLVDLAGVRMIDSKGLGILIATVNSLESTGRGMRVVGANEDLLGLFKMMRLDRHMRLG